MLWDRKKKEPPVKKSEKPVSHKYVSKVLDIIEKYKEQAYHYREFFGGTVWSGTLGSGAIIGNIKVTQGGIEVCSEDWVVTDLSLSKPEDSYVFTIINYFGEWARPEYEDVFSEILDAFCEKLENQIKEYIENNKKTRSSKLNESIVLAKQHLGVQ